MEAEAEVEVCAGGDGGAGRAGELELCAESARALGLRLGGLAALAARPGAELPPLARRVRVRGGRAAPRPLRLRLPERELENVWCEAMDRHVVVSPLYAEKAYDAEEICLRSPVSNTDVSLDQLKMYFLHRLVVKKNKLVYWHFGRKLEFTITNLRSGSSTTGEVIWYRLNHRTKWSFESQSASTYLKKQSLGGFDGIIKEIEGLIKLAFDKKEIPENFQRIRGVLLYGHTGTGKTAICKYLIEDLGHYHVEINGPSIFSKYFGETESIMKSLFSDAIKNEPSIIFVDEIDTICPKKGPSSTEQERRVMSAFVTLLDSLHQISSRVFVLATTSRPEAVDITLRRFSRLDKELEVPIPDEVTRRNILGCLLQDVPHCLMPQDIKDVCELAHGYVSADLVSLCTQAWMRCMQRAGTSSPAQERMLQVEDLRWALSMVKPSAMRQVLVEVPDVRWSDIGGQQELKLKLKQAVEWPLKHSDKFEQLGIKPPSGVLMYGPPGCSKTMIAKALATESGLNFISIKGPELFSKWVGESEKAVRNVFNKARQVAPAIIFFDELDALGAERGGGAEGGGVHERVLAQILTELDGVVPLSNVTVVAATNRPDKIDPALLRPGRIDRIVYVPLPDDDTRTDIFNIKLSRMRVCAEVCLAELVSRTRGFSGAEVQAVCHEAALKALEEDIHCDQVQHRHFNLVLSEFRPRTPASLLQLYEQFSLTNRS